MFSLVVFLVLLIGEGHTEPISSNTTHPDGRDKRQFSLFSVVNFPNLRCTTSAAGATTYGTCISTSECTSRSGSASGTCAAGFGVCCYMAVSVCGSSLAYNNTYIQNPGYPSSYTPTTTGTCMYTINKISSDVCQLRLDFQTFTGFAVTAAGVKTDSMAAAGQTGKNPPTISGTNSGYHMYVNVGSAATDTGTVTMTWGNIVTAKQYNIFVQQIECSSKNKAPQDCVQYYTGTAGTIQSYGWAGAQLLAGMDYKNCIRTELGYCGIEYKETTGTSIDAFAIFSTATNTLAIKAALAESTDGVCSGQSNMVTIPMTSLDGVSPIPVATNVPPYPTEFCGGLFGISTGAKATPMQSNQRPFNVHLFTSNAATPTIDAASTVTTGFSLDYTQIPCGI